MPVPKLTDGGSPLNGDRSAALDLVRIVGIVAVVVGHTWETEMFQRLVYSWQVPVFFVLTGYLWKDRRPLATEVHNRARTLLRPYIFWLVVVGALFLARSLAENGTERLSADLTQMLLGGAYAVRPFTAFWFATALFFGAIGLRLVQRLPLWGQCVAAAALLAVAYIAPALVRDIPLAAGTGVACVAFVLAGRLFRQARHAVRGSALVGGALVAGGLVLSGLDVVDSLSLKNAHFGTPVASFAVAIAISVGLVLIAEQLVPLLPAKAQEKITMVALCGLMVVLTHPVILWALSTPPTGSWIAFAAALTIPWAAALVLLRTPLSPWALGVPRRQRRQAGLAGLKT